MTRTVDEFLGGYQPPRLTVTVTRRADLLAELNAAADRREHLKVDTDLLNGGSEARDLEAEMERLADEIAASAFAFEFEALGAGAYQELLDRHPPLPQQRKDGAAFNPATFPQALIAACSVNPEITVEQAEQLMDALSEHQFKKLWAAAVAVNIGDDSAPKFVRSSLLADAAETLSDTPLSTLFPDQSSSDE